MSIVIDATGIYAGGRRVISEHNRMSEAECVGGVLVAGGAGRGAKGAPSELGAKATRSRRRNRSVAPRRNRSARSSPQARGEANARALPVRKQATSAAVNAVPRGGAEAERLAREARQERRSSHEGHRDL